LWHFGDPSLGGFPHLVLEAKIMEGGDGEIFGDDEI